MKYDAKFEPATRARLGHRTPTFSFSGVQHQPLSALRDHADAYQPTPGNLRRNAGRSAR